MIANKLFQTVNNVVTTTPVSKKGSERAQYPSLFPNWKKNPVDNGNLEALDVWLKVWTGGFESWKDWFEVYELLYFGTVIL